MLLNKKIQFFNMIEVLLALTVIAIGMSSILGLFPVGLNASRNAIAENMSADVADQMVTYIRVRGESTDAAYIATFVTSTTSLPIYDDNHASNPDNDNNDSSTLDIYTNTSGVTTINLNGSEVNIGTLSDTFLSDYKSGDINPPGSSITDDFTRVASGWSIFKPAGASDLRRRVYFIVQGANSTEDGGNRNIDYSAMALVWKSPIQIRCLFSDSATWGLWPDIDIVNDIDADIYQYSGQINIELSWPLELAYSQRKKRYYQIVISRP